MSSGQPITKQKADLRWEIKVLQKRKRAARAVSSYDVAEKIQKQIDLRSKKLFLLSPL